ncbi:hypothetical protein [Ekhidna sp.]|uniref:hypothetical protein n=1 Tax=Ekhidna sp. TaxID=2608089 RepID=UPI0032EFF868
MSIENLNNVIGTFHDFELVSAEQQGTELTLGFENCWNEMNDPEKPFMKLNFTFDNCQLIECTYYVNTNEKDQNGHWKYNDLTTKQVNELPNLELSAQSFEIVDGVHNLHCNGYGDIDGGILKLRFNSPEFRIFDEHSNQLELEDYRQLHERWWNFVGS